jgi:hypothetical protein
MTTTMTNIARERAGRLERRYDAENDTTPGAPTVTWADMQIAEAIMALANAIDDLYERLEQTNGRA